jgi:uncharacterized protein (TIGR03000 family)
MLRHQQRLSLVVAALALAAASVHAQSPEAPVSLTLLVPTDARVDLDSVRTVSTGSVRRFASPPVPVGQRYVYNVKVIADGRTVTRKVAVLPGVENTVDLRSDFGAGTGQRVAAYPANDSAAGAKPGEDQQVITSKATRRKPAASVNFRQQLSLAYPSLATLGTRIDTARRAPDPVALAHAASELAVAEKVSGKQADLTSTAVLKEAAELAGLRRQASELRAVGQVAQQIAAEQNLITNLRKQVAIADETAKMDKQSFQQNEAPTWAPRKVLVNNYTSQYLTIYVNGRYKGEMGPGAQQTYVIEHRWNPTVLTAHGDEDVDTWGPVNVWGRFDVYTWNIN